MRRRAAADADLEPALAQMIEHADFFGEPQRMMRRQYIDQRAERRRLVRCATAARNTLGDGVILSDVE